jgi:hypothetical protein
MDWTIDMLNGYYLDEDEDYSELGGHNLEKRNKRVKTNTKTLRIRI